MKTFIAKTKLRTITHCKQFKAFKKYIIAPRAFRAVMGVYSLNGLKNFYPFNADDAAQALNQMRNMADGGNLIYTPFGKKDVGLYSFLIGNNRPFVLILPGGGYGDVCSLIEGFGTAVHFNKLGYNAFIGQYSVGKNAHYPSPQDDVASFIKFIFENAEKYSADTANYAVCGFSAGGHLAATWGLKSIGYAKYNMPAPVCEILCYPVITMGEYTHIGSRKKLLGKDDCKQSICREYSVELQADGDYPKTFIWQCVNDNVVSFNNSLLMVERLKSVGVDYRFMPVEGNKHGLGAGIGSAAEGWIEKATDFWKGTIK